MKKFFFEPQHSNFKLFVFGLAVLMIHDDWILAAILLLVFAATVEVVIIDYHGARKYIDR